MFYFIAMHIPVFNIDMAVFFCQMRAQLFCHKHGAVHPACTADGNGKLPFSCPLELIDYKVDEIIEVNQEILCGLFLFYIVV